MEGVLVNPHAGALVSSCSAQSALRLGSHTHSLTSDTDAPWRHSHAHVHTHTHTHTHRALSLSSNTTPVSTREQHDYTSITDSPAKGPPKHMPTVIVSAARWLLRQTYMPARTSCACRPAAPVATKIEISHEPRSGLASSRPPRTPQCTTALLRTPRCPSTLRPHVLTWPRRRPSLA